jgi:16S rRNA (cytidine1402-2'-O)-methyltransferase
LRKERKRMGWKQSSYSINEGEGCLYLVPTPIGNLQDMTFRAIDTLKQVDYIAAEDTRQTRKLLNFFEFEQRLVSYHEHNKEKSGQVILDDLKMGKRVALVTDAGMPGISDPGEDLARIAIKEQIAVIALPGPNAALTALIASGLSTEHFMFYGFLDRNKKKREALLEDIKLIPTTLIFYEAPHRLKETLHAIYKAFGERDAALVREISKKYEEYIRGTLSEVIQWAEEETIRGEFSILISGNTNSEEIEEAKKERAGTPWWFEASLNEHIEHYIEQGHTSKEAIKLVAKDRDLPKREVYQAYHVE